MYTESMSLWAHGVVGYHARLAYMRLRAVPGSIPVSALPLVPTPTIRPDARFMVTVYGPREDQAAEFKTRAGHKVKKVLESVCKTFGVPHERARLVLEVNVKGEQWLRECHPDETMGNCGVVDESRLLLQVDGVSEDDEYEE
ncbi:hypothetical protein H0H92_012412 [Tricholoma furcatifolium]|nr:hypothetical protein H0H92_012412 [Tricholoma furcatifolium]